MKVKYILIIISVFFCFLMIVLISSKNKCGTKKYQITFTGKDGNECFFFLNSEIQKVGKNLYRIQDFGFIKFMLYRILPSHELEENINSSILTLQKWNKSSCKIDSFEKYGWVGKNINLVIEEEGYDTYNYALAKGNYYLCFTLIKDNDARIQVSTIADEILTSFRPLSPLISKRGNDYVVKIDQNGRSYQIITSHFPLIFQNRKYKRFAIISNDIPILLFTVHVNLITEEQNKFKKNNSPVDLNLVREKKINGWKIKFMYSSTKKEIICTMLKRENFIFIQALESIDKKHLEETIDNILVLLSTLKVESLEFQK